MPVETPSITRPEWSTAQEGARPLAYRQPGWLRINSRYRDWLAKLGLTEAAHFLELPGVIICGHPDRHVVRVTLGEGPDAVTAFLKREHCVPWRDRLANAAAGFGFVAKSVREARQQVALAKAGIPCPAWLAAGEDGQRRAFLLVREQAGARDLRRYLAEEPAQRRDLARRLGALLARMHEAGFDQPDLFAKHVLVVERANRSPRFCLLDWARSRHRRQVGRRARCRDLAALHASLADELASPRDRLALLWAYLRKCGWGPRTLRRWAQAIDRRAKKFLAKRYVQEMRQPAAGRQRQGLIWLDGEALMVTPEYHQALAGKPPLWRHLSPPPNPTGRETTYSWSLREAGQKAVLAYHITRRQPFRRLWAWLRRQPVQSEGLRQAALLFRLQRYGVATPRLLAVGQTHQNSLRTQSWLLTVPRAGLGLAAWVAGRSGRHLWSLELRQHRQIVRRAGALIRRVHDAGCYLPTWPKVGPGVPLVITMPRGAPALSLGDMGGITTGPPTWARALRNLRAIRQSLAHLRCSRTDQLRFLLSYLGQDRLDPKAKQTARALIA